VVAEGEKGLRLNFRGAPLELVLDYLSEAAGFIIRPEVDEERAGLVIEHVIMDRRDLDAIVAQGFDERIHLAR